MLLPEGYSDLGVSLVCVVGPGALRCQSCTQSFHSAWDLLQHAQLVHTLHIYTTPSATSPVLHQSSEEHTGVGNRHLGDNQGQTETLPSDTHGENEAFPTGTERADMDLITDNQREYDTRGRKKTLHTDMQEGNRLEDQALWNQKESEALITELLRQNETIPNISQGENEALSMDTQNQNEAFATDSQGQNEALFTDNQNQTEALLTDTQQQNEFSPTESANQSEALLSDTQGKMDAVCSISEGLNTDAANCPQLHTKATGNVTEMVTPHNCSAQLQSPGGNTQDAAVQTCQDPLGVQACEKRARRSSCQPGEEVPGRLCCDRAECGVTVMPGTHENLKKCCSVVIPKKRKRHMETKHLQAFTGRLKKRALERVAKDARSPPLTGIYIDIETPNKPAATASSPAVKVKTQGQVVIKPPVSHKEGEDEDRAGEGSEQQSPDLPECCRQRIEGKVPSTTAPLLSNTGLQVLGSFVPLVPSSTASLPVISTFLPAPLHNQGTQATVTNSNNGSSPQATARSGHDAGEIPKLALELPGQEKMASDRAQTNSCQGGIRCEREQQKGKKRRYPTSRPFKCDKCDHAFNQRVHLRKHESKHTGKTGECWTICGTSGEMYYNHGLFMMLRVLAQSMEYYNDDYTGTSIQCCLRGPCHGTAM